MTRALLALAVAAVAALVWVVTKEPAWRIETTAGRVKVELEHDGGVMSWQRCSVTWPDGLSQSFYVGRWVVDGGAR